MTALNGMLRILSWLYYPIVLLLLVLSLPFLVDVGEDVVRHLEDYVWLGVGIASYLLVRRLNFFSRNEEWLQTMSHELSHAFVGMLFLHKIHSLQTSERSGTVYHSGRVGGIFISLAPYTLPLLTYMLMLLRLLGDNEMLYIFDLLIGFTLGFYIVCFYRQTRPYQTDIKGQGYLRSLLFILVAWIVNATIILLTTCEGLGGAIVITVSAYWDMIVDFWWYIF